MIRPAGKAEFSTQHWVSPDGLRTYEDRASYYAADSPSLTNAGACFGFNCAAFEEYRYDALDRPVWVLARRACENAPAYFNGECRISTVRRVVWDGASELYEIQMPGAAGSR